MNNRSRPGFANGGMLCVRTRVAFRIVPAAFCWPGSMSKSSSPNEANFESPRLESPWTLK